MREHRVRTMVRRSWLGCVSPTRATPAQPRLSPQPRSKEARTWRASCERLAGYSSQLASAQSEAEQTNAEKRERGGLGDAGQLEAT